MQALREGGLLVGEATSGRRWRGILGEPWLFSSWDYPVVIEDEHFCALVAGTQVRLDVRVDDRAGRVVESSVAVTVRGWASNTDPGLRAGRKACCADLRNRRCHPDGAPMRDASVQD